MRKLTFLLTVLTCVNSNAMANEWREKVDTFIISLIGNEKARDWLGIENQKQVLFAMPAIPIISEDATKTVTGDLEQTYAKQSMQFDKLSQEDKRKYYAIYIQELSLAVMNKQVSDQKLSEFVNVLEQGGTREGIYRSFVLSENYKELEFADFAPKSELVNFVLIFSNKYLALNYDASAMSKVNVHIIKRIVVEKTLEIMDALAQNPDDLYRWYTFFAIDLASNQTDAFMGAVRKNRDQNFHYNWVRNVPYQQIKSEVIIRLHKVMNRLNS